MCVWAGWTVSLRVSTPSIHLWRTTESACKRACVYVFVMQNSLASHPSLEKKKSQPGGHFEIPGAHLANPGNWGVYISTTEKGKRPDAPLSCVHIEITHITKGDRPVCVRGWWWGGVEVYRESCMGKVTKHPMMTCSVLWHDIMLKFSHFAGVCLHNTHFQSQQTTHTHTPHKHPNASSVFLFPTLPLITPFSFSLAFE